MSAPWLRAFAAFLLEADARFRALAEEVRATAQPGPAGDKGEKGDRGEQGERGQHGFVGPTGEKGALGERGSDGAPGPQGLPGEQGPQGAAGDRGEKGLDGRDGRDGPQGAPGQHGKDGAPGKDGVTLEQFAAALDVATQKAAADVLAAIEFDGRIWKIGDRTIRTPAPEYHGVYREGESYEPGDFVTWAGSLYACRHATTTKPGEGTNPAWSLAAKKGRDGRDGKDGAPAPLPVVTVGGAR